MVIEAGARAVTSWLVAAGLTVHVVDGKQARRFVESISSSGAKTDKLDAKYAWLMAQSPMHLNEPVSRVDGHDRAMAVAIRSSLAMAPRSHGQGSWEPWPWCLR